jgi:hypothetical protein
MDRPQDQAESRLSSERNIFNAEPFIPRRGVRGSHAQTLVSYVLPRVDRLPDPEQRLIEVEPDVRVLCHAHWQPDRKRPLTVLIIHGLEGSSESQYVIGTANKAWDAGMNVVRMNVRNCGGSESYCSTLYHSGLSGDIAAVAADLARTEQLTRVAITGFSMGGNQVLKLMGEWGAEAPPYVRAAAVVSPSTDLSISADALHRPENRIYEWKFLLSLRARLRRKVRLYPDNYDVERWWWSSIRDFDNDVTACHFGFGTADEYYARASSGPVVDRIALPTLVIHSKDDPFIRMSDTTRQKLIANDRVYFFETEHGGHCGFLAAADGYDGRWAERQIMRFFGRFQPE